MRLRTLRWIANSFWIYLAVILILNFVRWLFPSSEDLLGFVWLPFGLSMVVVGPVWFIVAGAFLWRLVRCPRCKEPFNAYPIPSYVPKQCAHCRFDVSRIGAET
jgi:hypothetical protein